MANNPIRGCGTKHEGGFYLESDSSPMGVLHGIYFVVGDQVVNGKNCTVSIPPRGHTLANLAGTLLSGFLWRGKDCSLPGCEQLQRRIGRQPLALFDHVGSDYTAHSFAVELRNLGPSRRVTKTAAMDIAGRTPIPIVFTKSIPIFPDRDSIIAVRELLTQYAKPYFGTAWYTGEWQTGAVWEDLEWGLNIYHPHVGDNNDYIPALQLIDYINGYADEALKAQGSQLLENAIMMECPFVGGWITRVNYYRKGNEDTNFLRDLLLTGIDINDLDEPELVPFL